MVGQSGFSGGEAARSQGGVSSVALVQALLKEMGTIVQGKGEVIRLAVVTVLAGGHLLLEDVPGVGKTTLALALSAGLGCSFSRIQFTSDLLPTDVLGMYTLTPGRDAFELKPGPIFAQVILADEINRTTPKTQSCLLEAMADSHVTLDGNTHALPEPFIVIATQNPIEHQGTFPLPESQLDRFLMRLKMGYPDTEAERRIIRGVPRPKPGKEGAVLTPLGLLALQAKAKEVRVSTQVEDYMLALISASREHAHIELGVSPRGARDLYLASQALALMEGRDYVIPDDVKSLAVPVLAHRIKLAGTGGFATPTEDGEAAIRTLLEAVPVAG